MAVKPIPDGYRSVTPFLNVKACAAAIDHYKTALGAEELHRMGPPGGPVMHAELQLGESVA